MPSQQPTIDTDVAEAWIRPVIVILSVTCLIVAATIAVLLVDMNAPGGMQEAYSEPVEVGSAAQHKADAAELRSDRALMSLAMSD